jgi:hypothetical protein
MVHHDPLLKLEDLFLSRIISCLLSKEEKPKNHYRQLSLLEKNKKKETKMARTPRSHKRRAQEVRAKMNKYGSSVPPNFFERN